MKFYTEQDQGQFYAMKQHDKYSEQGQISKEAGASIDTLLKPGNLSYTKPKRPHKASPHVSFLNVFQLFDDVTKKDLIGVEEAVIDSDVDKAHQQLEYGALKPYTVRHRVQLLANTITN